MTIHDGMIIDDAAMCELSGCERTLRADNRIGYCRRHRHLSPDRRALRDANRERENARQRERYATDPDRTLARHRTPEYRERHNERQRALYASDASYREQERLRDRKRRATDPAYRDRKRARDRKRYTTDPDYRERANARARARYATDSEYRERRLAYQRERGTGARKHLWQLLIDQGGLCGICGDGERDSDAWQVDHIVALANGGGDEYENLQAAHMVM